MRGASVQPAFVVGHPRSGTTLLRALLDRHGDISMPTELTFAVAFDPSAVRDMEKVYRALVYDRAYWGLGISPRFTGDYAAEMRGLVEDIGRRSDSRVAGGIIHDHVDRVVEIWPEAKLIHIVRDVRDVVLSARDLGLGGNSWAVASAWARSEQLWDDVTAELPSNQALLVRYEDLVHDHEKHVTRVLDFLECESTGFSLADDPTGFGRSVPFVQSAGRWRVQSDQVISRLIAESFALDSLRSRGYPVTPSRTHRWIRPLSPALSLHDKIWRRRVAMKRHGMLVLAIGSIARRLRLRRLRRWSELVVLAGDEVGLRAKLIRDRRRADVVVIYDAGGARETTTDVVQAIGPNRARRP